MFEVLKNNRKRILIVLICFLLIVSSVTTIIINFSKRNRFLSASDYVEKNVVENINFCADKNFFQIYPDNTVKCIDEIVENKMDCVILDTFLTKDKKAVCCSTSNTQDLIGIEGTIRDYTYFELIKYNLKTDKDDEALVLNLANDVVEHCIENAVTPVIFPHNIDNNDDLFSMFEEYQDKCEFVLVSEDYDFLLEINKKYPSVVIWYKIDEISDEIIESLNLLNNFEIIFDAKNYDKDMIEKLNEREYPFGCYNLNKKSQLKKYCALSISTIITSEFVK